MSPAGVSRAYLRVVQALVFASAVLFGLMAGALANAAIGERVASGVLIAVIWLALHVGYLLAPRCYRTPRRKRALWLMAVPALAAAATMLFSINAALADVAVNHHAGLLAWIALYVTFGAAVYLVPPCLMLTREGA